MKTITTTMAMIYTVFLKREAEILTNALGERENNNSGMEPKKEKRTSSKEDDSSSHAGHRGVLGI